MQVGGEQDRIIDPCTKASKWTNLLWRPSRARHLALTRHCFTSNLDGGSLYSLCCSPPTCNAYPIAIILQDLCTIYAPPPTPPLYAIHHTILGMVILCNGQLVTRRRSHRSQRWVNLTRLTLALMVVRGWRSLLANNRPRVRIPWGTLAARGVRSGQFGWSHPVSLSGEDSCFVISH